MAKTIRSQIILDAVDKSAPGIQQATRNLRKLDQQVDRTTANVEKQFAGATKSVTDLGKAFAGFTIGREVADQIRTLSRLTDTAKLLQGQLRALGLSQDEASGKFDELNKIATENRTAVDETISSYIRIRRALQGTANAGATATGVVDALTKAVTLSNVSSETARAGLIQFAQGFGSAGLAGEELRSVMENLPVLAQTIADGLGVTVQELRNLGAEGKLTKDILTDILVDANASLDARIALIPVTIGQALTQLGNATTQYAKDSETLNELNDDIAAGIQFVAENLNFLAGAAADVGTVLALLAVPKLIGAFERRAAAIQANNVALVAQAKAERAAGLARVAAARDTLAAAKAEATLAAQRKGVVIGSAEAIKAEVALGKVRRAQIELTSSKAALLNTTLTKTGKINKAISASFGFLGKRLLPLLVLETAFGGLVNIGETAQAAVDSLGTALGGDVKQGAEDFREALGGLKDEQGEAVFISKLYEGSIGALSNLFEPGSTLSTSMDAFKDRWTEIATETKRATEAQRKAAEAAKKLEEVVVAAGRLPTKFEDAKKAVEGLNKAFSETTQLNIDSILETGFTGQTFEGVGIDIGIDEAAKEKILSDVQELNSLVGEAGEQQVLSVAERAEAATKLIKEEFDARVELQLKLEERLTKLVLAGAKERSDVLKGTLEARQKILEGTIEGRQKVLDTILKREKKLAKEILKIELGTSDARDAIGAARGGLSSSNKGSDKKKQNLIKEEREAREEVSKIRALFEKGDNTRALKAAEALSDQILKVANKANQDREIAAEESGLSAQGVKFVLERELNDILIDLDTAVQENDTKRKQALLEEQKALQTLGTQAKTELDLLQKQAATVISDLNKAAKIDIDLALETAQAEKALDDLTRDRTVKIAAVTTTVQAKNTGGAIEAAPSAGSTDGFQPRQGQLSGFGGGDRVKALLEPGEFIINKDAAKDIGAPKLNELNTKGEQAIRRQTGGPVNDIQKLQNGGFVKEATASELIGVAISGKDLDIEANLDLNVKQAERAIGRLSDQLDRGMSRAGDTLSSAIGQAQADANFGGLSGAKLAFAKGGRANENLFQRQDRLEPIKQGFNQAVGEARAALRAASSLGAAEIAKAEGEFAVEAQALADDITDAVGAVNKDLLEDLADLDRDLSEDIASINADRADDLKDVVSTVGEDTLRILQDFQDSSADIRKDLASTIKNIREQTRSFSRTVDELGRKLRNQGTGEEATREANIKAIIDNNVKIREAVSRGDIDLAKAINQDTISLVEGISERVKDQFGRTVQDTRTSSEEALSFLTDVRQNNTLIADAEISSAKDASNFKLTNLEAEAKLEIANLEDTAALERKTIVDNANLRIAELQREKQDKERAIKDAAALELSEIKSNALEELALIKEAGKERLLAAEESAEALRASANEQLAIAQKIRDVYSDIAQIQERNVGGAVNTLFSLGGGVSSEGQLLRDLQEQFGQLIGQSGGGGGGSSGGIGGSSGGGGSFGGGSGGGTFGVPSSSSFSKTSGSVSTRSFNASGTGGGTGFAKRPKASRVDEDQLDVSLTGNGILQGIEDSLSSIHIATQEAPLSTVDALASIDSTLANLGALTVEASPVTVDTVQGIDTLVESQVSVQRATAKANVQRGTFSSERKVADRNLLRAIREPQEFPIRELGGFLSSGISQSLSRISAEQIQAITGLSRVQSREASGLSGSQIENRLTLQENELTGVIQGLIDVEKDAADSRQMLAQSFENNAEGLGFNVTDSSAAAFRELLTGAQRQKEGGTEAALNTAERFGAVSAEQAEEIRSGLAAEAQGKAQFAKQLATNAGLNADLVESMDDVSRLLDERQKGTGGLESRIKELLNDIAPLEQISRNIASGPLAGTQRSFDQVAAEQQRLNQERDAVVRKVAVDLTIGGQTATGEFDDDELLARLLAELEAQGRVSNQ